MACLIGSDCDAHFALLHLSDWFGSPCWARETGSAGRSHPRVVPINIPANALNGSDKVAGSRAVHRRTSQLSGCGIGFSWQRTRLTDFAVTRIIGCARQRARFPRHNVLRRSTVNGSTPARRLGSALLICHDINYTRHPAAGQVHSFHIYNYLQSACSSANSHGPRYTAETVDSGQCLTIREWQTLIEDRQQSRARRAGHGAALDAWS